MNRINGVGYVLSFCALKNHENKLVAIDSIGAKVALDSLFAKLNMRQRERQPILVSSVDDDHSLEIPYDYETYRYKMPNSVYHQMNVSKTATNHKQSGEIRHLITFHSEHMAKYQNFDIEPVEDEHVLEIGGQTIIPQMFHNQIPIAKGFRSIVLTELRLTPVHPDWIESLWKIALRGVPGQYDQTPRPMIKPLIVIGEPFMKGYEIDLTDQLRWKTAIAEAGGWRKRCQFTGTDLLENEELIDINVLPEGWGITLPNPIYGAKVRSADFRCSKTGLFFTREYLAKNKDRFSRDRISIFGQLQKQKVCSVCGQPANPKKSQIFNSPVTDRKLLDIPLGLCDEHAELDVYEISMESYYPKIQFSICYGELSEIKEFAEVIPDLGENDAEIEAIAEEHDLVIPLVHRERLQYCPVMRRSYGPDFMTEEPIEISTYNKKRVSLEGFEQIMEKKRKEFEEEQRKMAEQMQRISQKRK